MERYESILKDILGFVGIDTYDIELLRTLKAQPDIGKWRIYADDAWFQQNESRCETILEDFFVSLAHR